MINSKIAKINKKMFSINCQVLLNLLSLIWKKRCRFTEMRREKGVRLMTSEFIKNRIEIR